MIFTFLKKIHYRNHTKKKKKMFHYFKKRHQIWYRDFSSF